MYVRTGVLNYSTYISGFQIATCVLSHMCDYSLLTLSHVYPTTWPASFEAAHWKTPLSSSLKKLMCRAEEEEDESPVLLDTKSNLKN